MIVSLSSCRERQYIALAIVSVGFTPNCTHFASFEPQCASMRAGLASDYLLSSPHASALRLKVSANLLYASGTATDSNSNRQHESSG